jgi:hypothetical protein
MNRRIKEVYGFEGFKALNMKKNKICLDGITIKENITKCFGKLRFSGSPQTLI